MSNAGLARRHGDSHRSKDSRRSTKDEATPEAPMSVFSAQRTPMVASNRRRRGYQPDEVNRKPQKFEPEASIATEEESKATKPSVIETHPRASATDDKLASTMASSSTKPLPHQRFSKHQIFTHTQVPTTDASRPDFDLVHLDGVSEPVDSEISSIQIITERKPSCWTIASPPEAPPTEWNSSAANIDRPATTRLPIYRFGKPEHKAERDTACSSYNQQPKLKSPSAKPTSKAQEPLRVNVSPQLAIETNNGTEAKVRATSQEDNHAANSLHHQFQELQHDERLHADEATQIKAIQDEVLSRTIQTSPRTQKKRNQSEVLLPAQDTTQASYHSSDASSAVSSRAKNKPLYIPPGKRGGLPLPHLRVQTARKGANDKDESILGNSISLPSAAATKTITRGGGLERGRYTTTAVQVNKLPPHLQALTMAKNQATVGPASVITQSPTRPKNDDNYQAMIDMDEEISATQPVLDIDEEIVAGLGAEMSTAFLGTPPTDSKFGGTKEETVYVSPQAESNSKVNHNQTKSRVNQDGDRDHSRNTRSNELVVESYGGAPRAGEVGPVQDEAESSIKKGKKAAKGFASVDSTSGLLGWDGKFNQPPVGDEWDRRPHFNPRSNERLSVVEAWREAHPADPEANTRLAVDTASADFQTGEGLVGGDTNVLSPIDTRDHETLASKDDFTQARGHRSAADAIKDYEAKIATKPKPVLSGIEGMTREEKRQLRRALIEAERTSMALPNPHAPAANIYLRPAEFKDMGQVTTIYNYYVRETNFVHHLGSVDELYWRSRLQEAEDERNPFIVAIHMGEKLCRRQEDIIRKKQENVVGFAVAADAGSKDTMYLNSVELELMIHPEFYNQGTGRTLLDRILAALSPDHNLLECAPFLPHNDMSHWIRGGSRQAKAVLVNIHYSDDEEDVVAWRKQWLAKHEFQHVGTLTHYGFRKGKLVNTCQLLLETSVRR